MKKIIFALVFLGTASASFSQPNTQSVNPKKLPVLYNPEDKVYGLSLLWSEIKYNFANIDVLDFDLDSLYCATIPKVLSTTNDIEYFNQIERFLASMKDGHTELLSFSYSQDDYIDFLPATVIEIDKKLYFSAIRKNTSVNPKLFCAEIIEIDGLSTKEYVEKNTFPLICRSTENFRWDQSAALLQQGLPSSCFTGKAKTVDGEIIPFSMQRNLKSTRTPDDEYEVLKPLRIPRQTVVTFEWIDDIAFLDIRAFTPDVPGILDSLMPIINSKAKGLIVDLRYNRGGDTPVAWHLQQYFTHADSFLSYGSMVRTNNGYRRSQGVFDPDYKYADVYRNRAFEIEYPDTIKKDPSIEAIRCPTLFLIGLRSYSACEDFLVNMCEVPGRPLFIGEETGGSTGAPLVINLPHGAAARICTVKIFYPYSRKPFVQKGVMPDIELKPGLEDIKVQRDVVKEKAITLLKKG